MTRRTLVVWTGAAAVLLGLAIPWFLWGNRTTIAGVPIWVWWHAAWLLLTAAVFHLFATTAWGLGIERNETGTPAASAGSDPGTNAGGGEQGDEPGGEVS